MPSVTASSPAANVRARRTAPPDRSAACRLCEWWPRWRVPCAAGARPESRQLWPRRFEISPDHRRTLDTILQGYRAADRVTLCRRGDTMPLHASAKAFLDDRAAMGVRPVQELSVEQARAQTIRIAQAAGPGEPVARTEDVTIPGPLGQIPIRVYAPVEKGTL